MNRAGEYRCLNVRCPNKGRSVFFKANNMNNIKHLMIDIEAAGKSTSAALLSIGAVFFDPATGKLGEQFYQPVKLASAQYHGGTIDASTIEWWMQQSEEARSVFNAENQVSLKDALNSLAAFIKTMAGDVDVHVWGNGPAYDNAILATAFHATWIKQPWSFSKDTCVRTMVMLGRQLGINPKYTLQREGEHHNALDDAIHQARYVSTIWQALFGIETRKQLIYEVLDTSSDETYYPLGVFNSFEEAKAAIENCGDEKISEYAEDYEEIKIIQRFIGWNNSQKEVFVQNREIYFNEKLDEERCRLILDKEKNRSLA